MLAPGSDYLDLDCGIAYARIAAWLEDELSLPSEQDCWSYAIEGHVCHIALEPLENRRLGQVCLERARLTARGAPEALAAFEKLFTLRFISAGG